MSLTKIIGEGWRERLLITACKYAVTAAALRQIVQTYGKGDCKAVTLYRIATKALANVEGR